MRYCYKHIVIFLFLSLHIASTAYGWAKWFEDLSSGSPEQSKPLAPKEPLPEHEPADEVKLFLLSLDKGFGISPAKQACYHAVTDRLCLLAQKAKTALEALLPEHPEINTISFDVLKRKLEDVTIYIRTYNTYDTDDFVVFLKLFFSKEQEELRKDFIDSLEVLRKVTTKAKDIIARTKTTEEDLEDRLSTRLLSYSGSEDYALDTDNESATASDLEELELAVTNAADKSKKLAAGLEALASGKERKKLVDDAGKKRDEATKKAYQRRTSKKTGSAFGRHYAAPLPGARRTSHATVPSRYSSYPQSTYPQSTGSSWWDGWSTPKKESDKATEHSADTSKQDTDTINPESGRSYYRDTDKDKTDREEKRRQEQELKKGEDDYETFVTHLHEIANLPFTELDWDSFGDLAAEGKKLGDIVRKLEKAKRLNPRLRHMHKSDFRTLMPRCLDMASQRDDEPSPSAREFVQTYGWLGLETREKATEDDILRSLADESFGRNFHQKLSLTRSPAPTAATVQNEVKRLKWFESVVPKSVAKRMSGLRKYSQDLKGTLDKPSAVAP